MRHDLDRTERSRWARWSLALRLARREVRRHPWRHALVVLMIMVPVLASMVAFSAVSTSQAHFERKDSLRNYGSDLHHDQWSDYMTDPDSSGYPSYRSSDQRLAAALPAGSEVLTTTSSADWFSTAGQRADGAGPVLVGVETTSAPSPDLFDFRFDVESGSRPEGETDVFLTRTLADLGGWSVGDTIESGRDERSFTVTGIGYARDETTQDLAVLGAVPESYWTSVPSGYDHVVLGDLSSLDDGDGDVYLYSRELQPRTDSFIWLPDGTDVIDTAVQMRENNVPVRVVGLDAVSDILVPGLAIAAGALTAMVAIVASAAFAIASRRQLRSVGLLASAGADPATVRAALVLQGAIPGLIAALSALALGLTGAWAVGSSGLLESYTHILDARFVISVGGVAMSVVLGVLAGTLAAWWPARSASRIPVLSALAGRRPVGPVSTNVPLTGLAAVAAGGVGLALLVRRVGSDDGSGDLLVTITPLLMLGTVLAMLFGLVALAPTLVAVVGRLSTHVRGTTRIALRGIARHRTQSSAAVAAVAICLAVPVGVLTTKASIDDENARDRRLWDEASSVDGADSAGVSGDAGEPVGPMEASTSLVGEVPIIIVRGDLTSPAVDVLVEQVVAQAGPVIRVPFVAFGDGHGAWQIVAALDADAAASKLPAWAADHLRTGGAIAMGGAPGTITLDDDVDQLTLEAIAAPDGTPQHLSRWIEADYLVPSDVLTRIGVGRPPLNLLLLPQEEVEAYAVTALERSNWNSSGMTLQAQPSLADLRESLRTGQPVGPAADRTSWPTGAAEAWFEVERQISIDGEAMESDPSTTTTYQDQGEVRFRRWLLVVAVVAGALSLLVLTITLALRSVDSIDDHRAAIAAGAAPGRISRQRSLEGVVLATLGALLALPLGWLPVTATRFGQVRRKAPGQGSLDAITSRLHVPGWEILPILALPVVVVGVLWLVGPWLRDAVRRGPVDQVLPRY